MKEYRFSLQYPKPLRAGEGDLAKSVAESGLHSRFASELVRDVEAELAVFYGTKFAATCTSGTAALQVILASLGFPAGSEIITTSLTDMGVVIPIIYENLVPVFADVLRGDFNVSVDTIVPLVTDRTKAVVLVHLGGSPCDIEPVLQFCRHHGIVLIEDFSQAHGAEYKGKRVGSFGHLSFGSFQQSKQISCGEGGIVLTDDENAYARVVLAYDKGWERSRPLSQRFYTMLSLNYRFNALQAAVLRPQIGRLDSLLERKRSLAAIVRSGLSDLADVVGFQRVVDGAEHAYYSLALTLTTPRVDRDALLRVLDEEYRVVCAQGYANPYPLYSCANALLDPAHYGKGFAYASRRYPAGTCPNAEHVLSKSLLLPFNEAFSNADMEEIAARTSKAIHGLLQRGSSAE
jgi:dTDP-4-amino-4,6-dideoxygalactose transaminase